MQEKKQEYNTYKAYIRKKKKILTQSIGEIRPTKECILDLQVMQRIKYTPFMKTRSNDEQLTKNNKQIK